MNHDQLRDAARETAATYDDLGFDQLNVTALTVAKLGVRVAQSTVCRENTWCENQIYQVKGILDRRESGFSSQAGDRIHLMEEVRRLRSELPGQSPDREFVMPDVPPGAFAWNIARGSFADLYGPEVLYPLLEKHAAKVRQRGLRLTGYCEAQETNASVFISRSFNLETHDHGISITFTVDDPASGASGAATRASVHAPGQMLDEMIGDCISDAMDLCERSRKPVAVDPGDYQVVLSPSAVADLVNTALMYGMLDRRKVDEGRTWLSRAREELRFPEGMTLTHTGSLATPDGTYCDHIFNHRMVPCAPMQVISQGRINDLYVSAFWAKEHGLRETWAPWFAPPLVLSAAPGSELSKGFSSTQDLIGSVEDGIYVAGTWYLRMVAEMEGVITGMTRDGLFRIRNGRLAEPLINMRWHENPIRVLADATGLSANGMISGRSRTAGRGRSPLASFPALKLDRFHFSSVTKF